MREVRIIVAGSRDFSDYHLLEKKLLNLVERFYGNNIRFVSGMAQGADILGTEFANSYNYPVSKFPAAWNRFGKYARPIRNSQMVEFAVEKNCIGVLAAFWDGHNRSVKSMISYAKQFGMEIHIFRY